MLNGVPVVMAQTPAPTTQAPAPRPIPRRAAAAPPASVIPPAGTVVQTAGTPAARTLTLADVVNMAVNNNTTAILARQRLQKAQELIEQANAQARPQITANVVDTYSSTSTFGTQGATVTNPTLPGGGVIPTITDAGGGNISTLTTGGGGGTAASNGQSTTTGATATPLRPGSAGTGTAPSAPSPAASGRASGTTSTGTGKTGTGTHGDGDDGTGGTFGTTGPGRAATGGGAGAQAVALEEIPPIARQYAAVTQSPAAGPGRRGAGAGGAARGHPHHHDRHDRSRRHQHGPQRRPAQQLQRAGQRHAVH